MLAVEIAHVRPHFGHGDIFIFTFFKTVKCHPLSLAED